MRDEEVGEIPSFNSDLAECSAPQNPMEMEDIVPEILKHIPARYIRDLRQINTTWNSHVVKSLRKFQLQLDTSSENFNERIQLFQCPDIDIVFTGIKIKTVSSELTIFMQNFGSQILRLSLDGISVEEIYKLLATTANLLELVMSDMQSIHELPIDLNFELHSLCKLDLVFPFYGGPHVISPEFLTELLRIAPNLERANVICKNGIDENTIQVLETFWMLSKSCNVSLNIDGDVRSLKFLHSWTNSLVALRISCCYAGSVELYAALEAVAGSLLVLEITDVRLWEASQISRIQLENGIVRFPLLNKVELPEIVLASLFAFPNPGGEIYSGVKILKLNGTSHSPDYNFMALQSIANVFPNLSSISVDSNTRCPIYEYILSYFDKLNHFIFISKGLLDLQHWILKQEYWLRRPNSLSASKSLKSFELCGYVDLRFKESDIITDRDANYFFMEIGRMQLLKLTDLQVSENAIGMLKNHHGSVEINPDKSVRL